VGKTRVAVLLAERLGGELVSADSRQVYRGLDIGTNKARPAELRGIRQHLVDICDPQEPFTVADYQRRAWQAIGEVLTRRRLPILVGGSGLYVRAVVDGLNFGATGPNTQRRRRWEALADRAGLEVLQTRLYAVDPAAAARIHSGDRRRLIRALEVFELSGAPLSAQQTTTPPPHKAVVVGLTAPRDRLHQWIEERVPTMLARGLLEETARLRAAGLPRHNRALEGIGYAEMVAVLEGEMSLDAALAHMTRATRRYAKRQLTWFRADPATRWFDVTETEIADIERFVRQAVSWEQGPG
jgi:tRNA dimethylallyltransferase